MRHIGDELAEIVKPFDPVPIPTKYQGVEFRSRLEARWAVFMNALHVRWFYEYEGYKLGDVWYLPDFYLPDLDCWIEIKANAPNAEELEKLSRLAQATQKMAYLAFGEPGNSPEQHQCHTDSIVAAFPDGGEDYGYRWCCCPECGAVGIEFDGRGARVCKGTSCADRDGSAAERHRDKGYSYDNPAFVEATRKALAERFW